jgi:hypothetical protein
VPVRRSGGMMNAFINLFGFAVVFAAVLGVQAEAQVGSVYTDLSGPKCRTVKTDRETGGSEQKCPGVGGFHLLVADDDERMSVTVVSPDGKSHPLDYWEVITTAFSSLGKKAEWRVTRKQGRVEPFALIVRVEASEQEDPGNPKKRSYLAVAKITPAAICVVGKINSVGDANAQARQAADNSARQPCLKP